MKTHETSNTDNLVNTVELIKTTRKLLGITQRDLAKRTGLSYSLIAKAEAEMIPFTPDSIEKIFTVFESQGFSVKALMQLKQLMKTKGDK